MAKTKSTALLPSSRRLLTRAEAAEVLAVSPGTLSRWAAERQGPPFVKLNNSDKGAVRYPADGLEEFIASRTKREKTEGVASAPVVADVAGEEHARRRPK